MDKSDDIDKSSDIDKSDDIDKSFDWDMDKSFNMKHIVKNAEIFEGGALVAVGGDQKVVLETGDILKITASSSNAVDAVVSYMEQT